MSYLFTINFWEILLDVIALCLCGATVFYFVRNKIKFKQSLLKDGARENFANFNEVLIQLLGQSEMAFESIFDTIKKERRVLQEMIEKEIKNGENRLLEKELKQVEKHLSKKNIKYSDFNTSINESAHEEVAKLADMGLTVKEICERVKIPKGEIELILKFRKLGHEH